MGKEISLDESIFKLDKDNNHIFKILEEEINNKEEQIEEFEENENQESIVRRRTSRAISFADNDKDTNNKINYNSFQILE